MSFRTFAEIVGGWILGAFALGIPVGRLLRRRREQLEALQRQRRRWPRVDDRELDRALEDRRKW